MKNQQTTGTELYTKYEVKPGQALLRNAKFVHCDDNTIILHDTDIFTVEDIDLDDVKNLCTKYRGYTLQYGDWLNCDGKHACYKISKVPIYEQNKGCLVGLIFENLKAAKEFIHLQETIDF
jgi:hypothetical protein